MWRRGKRRDPAGPCRINWCDNPLLSEEDESEDGETVKQSDCDARMRPAEEGKATVERFNDPQQHAAVEQAKGDAVVNMGCRPLPLPPGVSASMSGEVAMPSSPTASSFSSAPHVCTARADVPSAPQHPDQSHTSQPWFHGTLSRQEAVDILHGHGMADGLFLIRRSSRRETHFVVSLCYQGRVYHNSIGVLEDGQYCYVGPNRVFRTISELVAFYTAITNAPHLKLTKAAPVTQHP